MITKEQIKDLLPKHQRNVLTDEMIDRLNQLNEDPLLVGSFKENFIGYISVMKTGKYSIPEYIDAIKWVTHKLLGSSDIDTYNKVFPERYARLIREGLTRDNIAPYASAYKKNKLVNQIMEQTLVPSYILNAPLYQEALNVQASLMNDKYVSPLVRQKAADSLLTHLKVPETTKIQLDVGLKENDAIKELREVTQQLAAQQRLGIASGSNTIKEIAHSKIMNYVEAEIDEQ